MALPPAFAASTSGSGREWVQGLGIIFADAYSGPKGPEDVPSHLVPAPDPKPSGMAESRDWTRAFQTLALSQELVVSGLTWVVTEGSFLFPQGCG